MWKFNDTCGLMVAGCRDLEVEEGGQGKDVFQEDVVPVAVKEAGVVEAFDCVDHLCAIDLVCEDIQYDGG